MFFDDPVDIGNLISGSSAVSKSSLNICMFSVHILLIPGAAVEAEFRKFSSMEKGVIDLIPAAVEAVKQESLKKMKLFSSDGKADFTSGASNSDIEALTRLVAAEVAKYLGK